VLASGCTRSLYYEIDPEEGLTRLRYQGRLQTEVDELALPLIQQGENIGIIVGILSGDGHAEVFKYGSADIAGVTAMNENSIFGVGSLTKGFVATLLATMVAEGTIGYNETVRDILPPNIELAPSVASATVRQLVTHTAGFEREPWNLSSLNSMFRFLFAGKNPYDFVSYEATWDYIKNNHLDRGDQPSYTYSNIGFGLLGILLEIRGGKSLHAMMQEKVCAPLGLHDTGYDLSAAQRKRLVQGYSGDHPKFMPRNQPIDYWEIQDAMRGSAGMHSSLHDLLVFAKANLGMIPGLPAAAIRDTHAVFLSLPTEDVTQGWFVQHFDNNELNIHYQYGLFGGHNAYIGFDKRHRTAVIVMRNNFNWQERIGTNLLRRLAFTGTSPVAHVAAPN